MLEYILIKINLLIGEMKMKTQIKTFDTIPNFCKNFRENVLQIKLKDMEIKTGVKLSTISAFENGRSNNLNHIYLYIDCCTNSDHDEIFLAGIKNTLRKGK